MSLCNVICITVFKVVLNLVWMIWIDILLNKISFALFCIITWANRFKFILNISFSFSKIILVWWFPPPVWFLGSLLWWLEWFFLFKDHCDLFSFSMIIDVVNVFSSSIVRDHYNQRDNFQLQYVPWWFSLLKENVGHFDDFQLQYDPWALQSDDYIGFPFLKIIMILMMFQLQYDPGEIHIVKWTSSTCPCWGARHKVWKTNVGHFHFLHISYNFNMKIYCQARDGCSTTSQSWQCSFDQVGLMVMIVIEMVRFIKCRCVSISVNLWKKNDLSTECQGEKDDEKILSVEKNDKYEVSW